MPSVRSKSGPSRQWRRPEPEEHINHHPIVVAGGLAAGASVLIGYLASFALVFVVWLFAGHGNESTAQVIRASGISWLGSQFVPIQIGGIPFGLLPWGFVLLPSVVLWKSVHWALKSAQPKSVREYWYTAGSVAAVYGLLGMLVSMFTSTNDLKTNSFRALLNLFVIAGFIASVSVLTYAPSRTLLIDPLPPMVKDGIRPGLIVVSLLIFLGTLLSTFSIVLHFGEIKSVATLMTPSALDGFFMMLLGISYLPTAAVWAMSYLIGPGIALGNAASISPGLTNPGRLPAFPLLAALPSQEFRFANELTLVLVAIGILLYLLIPREHWRPEFSEITRSLRSVFRKQELTSLAVASAILFVGLLIICVPASGQLGEDQLSSVGPNPLLVATHALVVIGFSALATMVLPRVLIAVVYSLRHRNTRIKTETALAELDGN